MADTNTSLVHPTSGQPASRGLIERLAAAVRSVILAAAQRWAWSTVAVPLAMLIITLAAFLAARFGNHPRLSAALDSMLIATTYALDPERVDGAGKQLPMRRLLHGVLDRISRGAQARRRDADLEGSASATPAGT